VRHECSQVFLRHNIPSVAIAPLSAIMATDWQLKRLHDRYTLGDLVLDLVSTTICCLAFLRDIFPDECFEEDTIGPDLMHMDTTNTQCSTNLSNKNLRIKRLVQNGNPGVDVFLNWIVSKVEAL
jgi:hypothetical protein